MANDVQPGEAATWPFVYDALSIVDLATLKVEHIETFAASEMRCANASLPVGACFVPRVLQLNATTLRTYFASENPGQRQAQVWYRDFDLARRASAPTIHQVELATPEGVFPMQPEVLNRHLAGSGFAHPLKDYGLYFIDGFKSFDGEVYAVLNNWPGGQLGLVVANAARDRFTLLGTCCQPYEAKLTESAMHRLPDGTWYAISRQENRDHRYMIATSPDGRRWTPHEYRPDVPNGANSKSNLERFNGVYYRGWQDAARVNDVSRSVFNVDVSRDGVTWELKYRFATPKSFQYAAFDSDGRDIYLTVTQGDHSACRKERIMFGRLEALPQA
jgi:hypothetical protein